MRATEKTPAQPVRVILCALVLLTCAAAGAQAEEAPSYLALEIAEMSARQRLEVKMKSGAVLVGRLGAVQNGTFILEPDRKGGVSHEIAFRDVYQVKKRWTRPEKWLVGITIFVLMGAMSALLGP